MGYGKTTAVREYLSNTGVNVLWQRVYDSGAVGFWNGFAELFRELDDDCCKNLVQRGFPYNALSMREAINRIENINLPNKIILVIDDYHLLDDPNISGFIQLLAENDIDNLNIVLIARFTKFERLEELKLKGFLHHITKEIFELIPKEIFDYYKTCGIALNNSEVQQLHLSTEGWISALYLLMLEYIAEGSFTPAESIFKLIEKTVYLPLSDQTKEIIIKMCIFDSFSLKQAEYMWGGDDTALLLAGLTENNSFVHYDGRLKIYHIHSIFTGFLREELEKKDAHFKRECYQKAAQWFMEVGDCFTARRFFYECGDFDKILLALEQDKANDYTVLNKDLLKKYIRMPEGD